MIIQECAIAVRTEQTDDLIRIIINNLKDNKCPKNLTHSLEFELRMRNFTTIKSIIAQTNMYLRPWRIGYRISKVTVPDMFIYDLVTYRWKA